VTARIPIARGRAKRFSSTGIYPACSAQNVVVQQLSPCRRSTQDRFLSVRPEETRHYQRFGVALCHDEVARSLFRDSRSRASFAVRSSRLVSRFSACRGLPSRSGNPWPILRPCPAIQIVGENGSIVSASWSCLTDTLPMPSLMSMGASAILIRRVRLSSIRSAFVWCP